MTDGLDAIVEVISHVCHVRVLVASDSSLLDAVHMQLWLGKYALDLALKLRFARICWPAER